MAFSIVTNYNSYITFFFFCDGVVETSWLWCLNSSPMFYKIQNQKSSNENTKKSKQQKIFIIYTNKSNKKKENNLTKISHLIQPEERRSQVLRVCPLSQLGVIRREHGSKSKLLDHNSIVAVTMLDVLLAVILRLHPGQ